MSVGDVPGRNGEPGRDPDHQPSWRYAPRLVDPETQEPDEPLTVLVDLPDDHSDEDVFAAMNEAVELLFPGITGDSPEERGADA